MLLLVIVSVAIIILVTVTSLLTTFFQPRSALTPEGDEADNTPMATNDKIGNRTAVPTVMPTTIDIVSTPSAFPFVQRWIAQYENQQAASLVDVNVDYLADREIAVAEDNRNDSDLAIVAIPNENRNALNVPVSAQAVAIVYNIPSFPDIPSGLRLNSTILFLILNGSITQWDDAALKELNPSLNLPNERIVVVHTGDDDSIDGSNSRMLLNRYLSLQSLSWPKNDSIIASGPADLAETVRKTPYSIGYVDYSYAVQTRMTYAAIADPDGDYVVPSMQSIGRAIDVALQFHNSSTDPRSPQQQQLPPSPPTINASRTVSDAYPIVGLYYVSLFVNDDDKDESERRRIAAMLDFVKWTVNESGGQQTLLEVQYPPIYSGNEQLAVYANSAMDTIQNSIIN
jgi:ABC-type phosphate transport system substrate-binding protein